MCAAAGVWLCAGPAAADRFETLRGGDASETSHAVRVTLRDGFAKYTVRRTIRNDAEYTDELGIAIDLPTGAAADGLRVRSGGTWHAGELMRAEKARDRFAELTDETRERPEGARLASRAPVLLEWEGTGSIMVRSFPVKPGKSVTFEYTAVAPTCYGNGRQYLDYPAPVGPGFVEPLIAVSAGEHGGKVALYRPAHAPNMDGVSCGEGIAGNASAHTTIEVEPPPIEHAAIRYGLYATAGGRFLARLDVDAAAQLEPLPKRARVVFVLDGSWSVGDYRLADQLALARGYLAHVPDAEVEVVVFRRYAERLFGELVPAERFDEAVLSSPPRKRRLANGSNLEEGVALAANLLDGTAGPARVVVFTDERMRNAYTNDLAIAAGSPLPGHAVLHVIERTSGSGTLYEHRDDSGDLAPLAAAFGGILLRISGDSSDPAVTASTMLGIVRPIRIDHFSAVAGDAQLDESGLEHLAEGDGRRAMVLLERKPERVVVTGKIWGRSWRRELAPHESLSTAVPALAFGDAVSSSMTEAEQIAAALGSGAVSTYTSYLAAEDRLVELPDDQELYGVMSGSICGGSCCGGSHCTISSCGGVGYGVARHVEPPRYDELLRGFMKSAVDNCGRASGLDEFSARLEIEVTGTEIVDVTVEGNLAAELRECLVDGAWDVRLSSEFDRPHQSYGAALYWTRD